MSDLALWKQGDVLPTGQVLHDLRLDRGKTYVVSGADEVAQRILIKLKTFLGEWFADREVGIPYYENILVKNPNLRLIESLIRVKIQEVPGVTTIKDFVMTFDKAARTLTVSFNAITDKGIIPFTTSLP